MKSRGFFVYSSPWLVQRRANLESCECKDVGSKAQVFICVFRVGLRMDREEVELVVGLAIQKHESRLHRKPRARQDKDRYDKQFLAFWDKFKGRWDPEAGMGRYVKVGKYDAWLEWKKMTQREQDKAIAVANRVSGKYVPDAHRWLKAKLYEDF